MQIAIINGPNLNLLGKRETTIYGDQDFESYFSELKKKFSSHKLDYFQSNSEGALIDQIQKVGFDVDGIVLNPAAYSHTSIGIRDAISAISAEVIEVHISNIYSREKFRRHSFISPVAKAVVSGFGLQGYEMAVDHLLNR